MNCGDKAISVIIKTNTATMIAAASANFVGSSFRVDFFILRLLLLFLNHSSFENYKEG